MEQFSYDYVKASFQKLLPTLTEADLKLIVDRVFMHLFEFEKSLLFKGEELAMLDELIHKTKDDGSTHAKLATIIQKKFSELTEPEQKQVSEQLLAELKKKGDEIYVKLNK